jgi:RHH-type proline utilization regulon transcriptional repressor/proline dehydrogenase/delta 1-pyrroline-5-carboxylate dehydrogenase
MSLQHRSSAEPAFQALRDEIHPYSGRRAAVNAAYRRAETECLPPLIGAATIPDSLRDNARTLARGLVEKLRARPAPGLVQGLIREYSLSSQEGVALMCLAEALLRIPDAATRDALIADKIAGGEWRAHLGRSTSPFVNAATWGLLVTGKLVGTVDEAGLSASLARIIARSGAPLIRRGVDTAMRLMGEQFVCGETIEAALSHARKLEARGFRYSYDMLGEAAATAADAARYLKSYEDALHAIGRASAGRGIYEGPGLSIKLSALHPRYTRSQRARVMSELLPNLKRLALIARGYDVGINIDAEETDRLDISMDLLDALCRDSELAGWNGIGFVVQAYQKRAYFVIDWVIELARATRRRIMIRLVKGAYWDSEIKRAQVDGQADFPVFTRKIHTDVSYLACARLLLGATDAVYPQFATHNALTLATIVAMAGPNYYAGQYEFQCLHGMGEPLYEQVVGAGRLNRPCRIYAPVGTHETLLAYLVRRLLENGANTSFVNRVADPAIPVDVLLEDPIEAAAKIAPVGAPHPAIARPIDLFGVERENSLGVDLSDEAALAGLCDEAVLSAASRWSAGEGDGERHSVLNPADHRDVVGEAIYATPARIADAMTTAAAAFADWSARTPAARAAILDRAAELLQNRIGVFAALMCREAGKALPNALGDVREAIDFLRYYGAQIEDVDNATHRPLGVVVCISPWNFPLAIFIGQLSAALAAGNCVLAKPAEETPLVAAAAIRLLREAGAPAGAVQLVVGAGEAGAALVAHPSTAAVVFTGSTEVARLIQATLSERLGADGRPVPLIAETGGQNALIVDSSALAEQVTADVLASAFDSAGQRCSALRILCLQEDIARRQLEMIKAAMDELSVGRPDRLSVDIGPVISDQAKAALDRHIAAMASRGFAVHAKLLLEESALGSFVAPTLIEINAVSDLGGEVFGPVLHVLRYRREALPGLIASLNASGFGLTGGVHSRIDETIDLVADELGAGNIYVNRNIIGAVVGVQPFGGHGLSGTGPKAGGPLYLKRLLGASPASWPALPEAAASSTATAMLKWLNALGDPELGARAAAIVKASRLGVAIELHGPAGERNLYRLIPRGAILCVASTRQAALLQVAAALAAGNRALVEGDAPMLAGLPAGLAGHVGQAGPRDRADAVLTDLRGPELTALLRRVARWDGAIAPVYAVAPESAADAWPMAGLVNEKAIAINTTAAGGNASLMSIG